MTFFHDDDIDDEIPDFDTPTTDNPLRPDAAETLARLSLEAALTRSSRAALKRHPNVSIIKVPHADYTGVLPKMLKRMQDAPVIKTVTEKLRQGGVYHRIGGDMLDVLREGRSLLFISQDPEEVLDEAVLAVADLTIALPAPNPAMLRQLINAVTGGRARNVTGQMAMLPLKVITTAVRQELTAGQCVSNLQRAVDRQAKPETSSVPVLSNLPLTASVQAWTNQIVLDLAGVKAGDLLPKELVFATLEGPPGTGKTLIAESLARTAGWAFVPSSVGTWFTNGDGALGGVAKNLKSFIDSVLASEPAIGFMDELDALPNRATMDNRGRDWWTPVINLFLTEIDRIRKSNKKVLLLGATNYYDRLDGALIRPGRLQQRIRVLPPQGEDEVADVLRHYLGDELSGDELLRLARVARGAVPAAVEGWVKEARAAARMSQRALTSSDLLSVMLPTDNRHPDDIRAIAIHEAGHAIVAHKLGRKVESISIVPEGQSGGHTLIRFHTIVPVWTDRLDDVAIALGGRAADIVLGKGANTGAEADLAHATAILVDAHEKQGLREELTDGAAFGPMRHGNVRAEVNTELKRQLARTVDIVTLERTAVMILAEDLIERKVLVGAEIKEIFGNYGFVLQCSEVHRSN